MVMYLSVGDTVEYPFEAESWSLASVEILVMGFDEHFQMLILKTI